VIGHPTVTQGGKALLLLLLLYIDLDFV
jgi:hypothetical protein